MEKEKEINERRNVRRNRRRSTEASLTKTRTKRSLFPPVSYPYRHTLQK